MSVQSLCRRPLASNALAGSALLAIVLLLVLAWFHSAELSLSEQPSRIYRVVNQLFEEKGEEVGERVEQVERQAQALRAQRALIEQMSCKVNGIGARGGFCLTKEQVVVGGNSWWDFNLARNLEQWLFTGQRVGDFGAGLGWYGRFWMRNLKHFLVNTAAVEDEWYFNRTDVMDHVKTPPVVKSWQGFDGAGNVEEMTSGWVSYLDLSDEHDLPVKFDWVFSLEVGEHIPFIYENTFIDNLIRHACKGIVLSWAVEGQGGHFHVNNHNNDYIIKAFEEKGFRNDPEMDKKLRADVILGHFANTVMVFHRNSPLNHRKCTSAQ